MPSSASAASAHAILIVLLLLPLFVDRQSTAAAATSGLYTKWRAQRERTRLTARLAAA
jgi:hypothetical protein